MLEALSYGLRVLANDIPANVEIGLPRERYFSLGDIDALAQLMRKVAAIPLNEDSRYTLRNWVKERYDWKRIARKTLTVYEQVTK